MNRNRKCYPTLVRNLRNSQKSKRVQTSALKCSRKVFQLSKCVCVCFSSRRWFRCRSLCSSRWSRWASCCRRPTDTTCLLLSSTRPHSCRCASCCVFVTCAGKLHANMFKSWYCPSPPCRVSWMVLWVESGPTLMIWGAAWSCSSSTSGWSSACRSCSLWALNVSHSSPTQSSTAELSSSSSSAATRSDRKHSSQSFVMHVIKKITL